MARPTSGPRTPWLTDWSWSAACTTRTMPTKRERRAAIPTVSVPTRTIWAITRWRSTPTGAKAEARSVLTNRIATSPSTCRTPSTPWPTRPSGPGARRAAPIASTAMARVPRRVGRVVVEEHRRPELLVFAGGETPEEVPVAGAVRTCVPAERPIDRRPHRDDAAVPGEETVGERRDLTEVAAVDVLGPEEREHGHEVVLVGRGVVGGWLVAQGGGAQVRALGEVVGG